MVEKSTDIYDVPDAIKDRGLLLVTVREGSNVLPMYVRRLSDDGKLVIDLEQAVHGGFRKIEPKPSDETKDDGGCDVQKANIGRDTRSPRLLESKSTRRGVRICPTCQGRVGYRSKVCKHCLLSSGGSNKSSTNVKKKRVMQQRKRKVNITDTKLGARLVQKETENAQETAENCGSNVPIENADLEISEPKSDEVLLYVSSPSSTLTTISNVDCPRYSRIECPVPRNVTASRDDVLCGTQTQPEDSEGDENFGKKQCVMHEDQGISCLREVDNGSSELSQSLDSEKFLSFGNKSVSNLPGMTSTQLNVQGGNIREIVERNPEVLHQNVDVEKHSNNNFDNFAGNPKHKANDLEHGTNNAENVTHGEEHKGNSTADINNSLDSLEGGEEKLVRNDKDIQCNDGVEAQNFEEMSVNTSEDMNLSDVVPQKDKNISPLLIAGVNSIGSLSMATSDNSQSVHRNENSVAMESETRENTFVFESTDANSTTATKNGNIGEEPLSIVGETNVGYEKHEEMKRKKAKVCQEQDNKRKKAKISCVQFVRIEPKPLLLLSDDSELKKNKQGILKQNRLLSSNPTKRGVMLCPLCQKDVGCRSRTCKYCKVAINLCPAWSPLEQKNLLAVELCQETCQQYTILSVKKTLNASEERCFVKKVKTDSEGVPRNETLISDVFYCDCVENNSIEKSSCEHTLCLNRSPKIAQARKTTLKPSKIDSLPIDYIYKLKLGQLWEKIKENEFPVVQQVCQNTLVVSGVDSNVETTPNAFSCVHVRFEKIRRRSSTELHIFCSGKTCSVWNEMEDREKDVPATCIHYCVSLWAISSDNELQKYFKVFLDAKQVYLHSEVFESIIRE